jgi:hypothetical protein
MLPAPARGPILTDAAAVKIDAGKIERPLLQLSKCPDG